MEWNASYTFNVTTFNVPSFTIKLGVINNSINKTCRNFFPQTNGDDRVKFLYVSYRGLFRPTQGESF